MRIVVVVPDFRLARFSACCTARRCVLRLILKVSEGASRVFRSMGGADGKGGGRAHGGMIQGWDEKKVTTPYSVSLPFEDKRLLAQVKRE